MTRTHNLFRVKIINMLRLGTRNTGMCRLRAYFTHEKKTRVISRIFFISKDTGKIRLYTNSILSRLIFTSETTHLRSVIFCI